MRKQEKEEMRKKEKHISGAESNVCQDPVPFLQSVVTCSLVVAS